MASVIRHINIGTSGNKELEDLFVFILPCRVMQRGLAPLDFSPLSFTLASVITLEKYNINLTTEREHRGRVVEFL